MRLLLCEDERAFSDALCAILTHNNYTVDAVYDGEDAYAYGLSDNYDGIFSRSAMSSPLSKYRLWMRYLPSASTCASRCIRQPSRARSS